MRFTAMQQAAIAARGSNLLVSAAAGSGKTAVLSERIGALVREGARVDDLLVVTFTRAAAAEMRARILTSLHDGALEGNEWLAQQAMRIERADISTLHGFCARVCRDFFQAAGVDPTFRVVDSAEDALLRAQAMEEALNACFDAPSAAFSHASLCLSQSALADAVFTLHTFLMARPDPWEWMEKCLAMYDLAPEQLGESAWMDVLVGRIARDAAAAYRGYEQLCAFAAQQQLYEAFAQAEMEHMGEILFAAQAGYEALARAPRIAPGRKPAKRKGCDEAVELRFVALREAAKKTHQQVLKAIEEISDLLPMAEALHDSHIAILGVYEATTTFDARYRALKADRNVLNYHDLEHFAYAALLQPEVSQAMREKYKHIFVDEYQDSSLLQEAILAQVAREDNLFMVGDIKQSIYRFRLAEPSLFLSKLESFSQAEHALCRKIFLSANFRSQPRVIQAVNVVFARVFCGGPMELSYDQDARLIPGLSEDADDPAVALHLIDGEADDDDTRAAAEVEAEIIAQQILAMRRDHGVRLRDMAILLRTVKRKATVVVETLRAHGIAAWTDIEEDALERLEILAMLSLLEVIDNMRQDIPLIAALMGPALGLSEEDLATIRIARPGKTFAEAVFAYAEKGDDLGRALAGFIERVRGWAEMAAILPLDVFIRRLYAETGYYAEAGACPDGGVRQGNLRLLAEHAAAFQRAQASGDLSGFLRYLRRVKSREGIISMELSDQEDIVRVLSIHKSKGLQFPAVWIAGLGSGFARMAGKDALQLHTQLGVGAMAVNPLLRTKQQTLAQRAILEKRRQEALAEEARILYVAMTRAKKYLTLIGTADEAEAPPSPEDAACMLHFILPAALEDGCIDIHRHSRADIQVMETRQESVDALVREVSALAPPSEGRITKALSFQAPVALDVPLKQSVSQRMRLEEKAGEREGHVLSLDELPKRPIFMEARGLTSAERGEAVHAFLRSIALDAADASSALDAMRERGILSAEQAKALPIAKIDALLAGPLWQRIRRAETLRREWAFNMRITHEGETTLLQGVIDCCFLEDDAWVLIDYKTDRSRDVHALVERYRPQLQMYEAALASITGKAVREKLLCFIEHEQAVRL